MLFLGDSVSAQHECDLRCQLAPWFVGRGRNEAYHFAGNVTVRYERAGGWDQCGPSSKVTEAMKSADLVIFNIGSHFGNVGAGSHCLLSRLQQSQQEHLDTFYRVRHSQMSAFVLRTQNAFHFNTSDGTYHQGSTNGGCVSHSQTTFWADAHRTNVRYETDLKFALQNRLVTLDVYNVSDDYRFHPGLIPQSNRSLDRTDCLHVCQNSRMLNAWNGLLYGLLRRL